MEMSEIKYRTRVQQVSTGLHGYVEGRIWNTTKFLLCLGRSEYTEEQWAQLSPKNGPTVSFEVEVEDLVPLAGPAKVLNAKRYHTASWSEVVAGAEGAMKRRPSQLTRGAGEAKRIDVEVKPGSKWKTRKGGYVYRVMSVVGDQVELSWVDGRDKRQCSIDNLVARYDFVEAGTGEVDPEAEKAPTVRQSGDDRKPEKAPADAPTPAIRAMYATLKNGDVYVVETVDPTAKTAVISWTAGKYKRTVTFIGLVKNYQQL